MHKLVSSNIEFILILKYSDWIIGDGISAVCYVAASTFTFEKIHMLAHLFPCHYFGVK